MSTYLTKCACGRLTSKTYARKHLGRCKACAESDKFVDSRPRHRNRFDDPEYKQEFIIDHGWEAYAREEGHYDIPGE